MQIDQVETIWTEGVVVHGTWLEPELSVALERLSPRGIQSLDAEQSDTGENCTCKGSGNPYPMFSCEYKKKQHEDDQLRLQRRRTSEHRARKDRMVGTNPDRGNHQRSNRETDLASSETGVQRSKPQDDRQ